MAPRGRRRGEQNLPRMKIHSTIEAMTGQGTEQWPDHEGVRRTLGFIRANHHHPIQVKDLQRVAGLSRRGLMKAFERQMGRGPGEIIREFRIKRAQLLLQTEQLQLGELASRCGYRRANSLWVAFRRLTGMTPHQYQQRVASGGLPRAEQSRWGGVQSAKSVGGTFRGRPQPDSLLNTRGSRTRNTTGIVSF